MANSDIYSKLEDNSVGTHSLAMYLGITSNELEEALQKRELTSLEDAIINRAIMYLKKDVQPHEYINVPDMDYYMHSDSGLLSSDELNMW